MDPAGEADFGATVERTNAADVIVLADEGGVGALNGVARVARILVLATVGPRDEKFEGAGVRDTVMDVLMVRAGSAVI